MSATVRPTWANAMPTIQRNISCLTAGSDLKLDLDRRDFGSELRLDRRDIG